MNLAIPNERDRQILSLEYALLSTSLKDFILAFWSIMDPAEFIDNWHIGAVCDHLEAVKRGEILRLMINIPPRCMKSLIVSVAYPAWVWLSDPSHRFLTASHEMGLSTSFSVLSRRIIESELYQDLIYSKEDDIWSLQPDQNQKSFYETTKGGNRRAVSVGGSITGKGGDTLSFDDPHNVEKKVLSQAERKADLEWYDNAFSTRLNNPKKSAMIGVMQRLHEKDVCGHALDQEDWVHLKIPAEYEGSKKFTCIGWSDPRTEPNELLWKGRLDKPVLEKAKKKLGSYGYAGQYQQRPAPLEGSLCEEGWFKVYTALPPKDKWLGLYQFWDTAQKDNEVVNCPWVCGTWLLSMEGLYLVHVFRDWMTYPVGKKKLKSLYLKYAPKAVIIEDKSTGSSLLQDIKNIPMIPFEPEGDKVSRFAAEVSAVEGGLVHIPEDAPWLSDFKDEITQFPKTDYDDQADMFSMSLKYLTKRIRKVKVEILGKTITSDQDW